MNQVVSTDVIIKQQEAFFNKGNTSNLVTWAKESQFAIQSLQNNTYTRDVALKNPASLQNAIINVAAIGISLNPANKHAYLVPRDGKVCLDISYMGLMALAVRSNSILWGQSKLVYSNDEYENNGIDKAPGHKQKTFGDKGEIIGCYCTVKLPSGDFLTEEMDIEALNKVKKASKAGNGPWKTYPEEMMRKTVVKRASKYWPVCEDLNKAVEILNEHEGFGDSYEPTLKEVGEESLFIDAIQIDELEGLILDTSSDRNAFLKFVGVDDMKDISIANYNKGLRALKAKAK